MAEDAVNSLTTLAKLKVYLDIGDNTDNTRLEMVIDAVSWFLNFRTNRELKARAQTEYHHGDGSNKLMLRQYPINSITSVHISTDSPRAYGADQLIGSTYIINDDKSNMIYYLDGVFSEGFNTVKVIYNGGYSTIPYDLERAAFMLASYVWKYERDKLSNVQAMTAQNMSMTINLDEYAKFVRETIENYRRVA
jgi:hypothetical protein